MSFKRECVQNCANTFVFRKYEDTTLKNESRPFESRKAKVTLNLEDTGHIFMKSDESEENNC